MSKTHISETRHGAVAVLSLKPGEEYMVNRTVNELEVATKRLEQDTSVRAIVLTGGHPGYFLRHYDVKELERYADHLVEAGDISGSVPERPLDGILRRLGEMGKPVIAAISGTAMGGGFELCLACDIRIAQSGDFALGQPEINIGILAGAGGTQRLARLIGPARALEMSLRGRVVGPDEALRLGMVHEVVGDALARAIEVAEEIAAKSPAAVAAIKTLIRQAAAGPLEEGLVAERTLFRDLLVGDEARALMRQMNAGDIDIRHMSPPDDRKT